MLVTLVLKISTFFGFVCRCVWLILYTFAPVSLLQYWTLPCTCANNPFRWSRFQWSERNRQTNNQKRITLSCNLNKKDFKKQQLEKQSFLRYPEYRMLIKERNKCSKNLTDNFLFMFLKKKYTKTRIST